MDEEAKLTPPEEAPDAPVEVAQTPKRSFLSRIPRSRLILVIVAAIAILGAAIAVGLSYREQVSRSTNCEGNSCNTNESVSPDGSATPVPTPTPVARYLDGALVTPGTENVRPLGVMIENHPDARPQSGLGQANWVYEAIAEGGITRFLALFANPDTEDIRVGPVRSVRTYYLDYAREYNAFLAHVGGNIDALNSIKSSGGITDLDQFSVGSAAFARDFSRNVSTEHTMYSSTKKLWDYITLKKYDKVGSYAPLTFVDEAAAADRGTAQTVSVNFSSASYAIKWEYVPASNSYVRTMANVAHKDANTSKQIEAKTIILQTVSRVFTQSADGKDISKMTLTGSGKAVIIANGKATAATWKREGTNRTRYYAADGAEINLTRGTTWVEVIHSDTPVSY